MMTIMMPLNMHSPRRPVPGGGDFENPYDRPFQLNNTMILIANNIHGVGMITLCAAIMIFLELLFIILILLFWQ